MESTIGEELLGRIASWHVRDAAPTSLREVEFRVWSQFGDDGIIQFLAAKLGLQRSGLDRFIEFGVEDYREANTRFLLVNDNWKGLVIDASDDHIASIRSRNIYWRHDLTAVSSFITVESVNRLFSENGFAGDIGILSIDIDGNDYWVWKSIDVVRPAIVICEYNSVLGAERAVVVPYRPDFRRLDAHCSGLYAGCSIGALCQLANEKGYYCVGSNSAGNNAYFVRQDLDASLPRLSAAQAYVESRFRESRDERGMLTWVAGRNRLKMIAGMPLLDVESGATVQVDDFA